MLAGEKISKSSDNKDEYIFHEVKSTYDNAKGDNLESILLFSLYFLSGASFFFQGIYPFIYAFICYIFVKDKVKLSLLPALFVAPFIFGGFEVVIRLSLYFIGVFYIWKVDIHQASKVGFSSLCALFCFLSGIIVNILFSLPIINNAYIAGESIFVFLIFYVYDISFDTLSNLKKISSLNSTQITCLAILVSIIICGFNFVNILGISLPVVLALCIILLSYKYLDPLMQLTVGIITSLILSLNGGVGIRYELIIIFTIASIISSSIKNASRYLYIFIFALSNIAVSFLVSNSLYLIVNLNTMLIGFLLYIVLDLLLHKNFKGIFESEKEEEEVFSPSINKVIEEEINMQKSMIKELNSNILYHEYESIGNITKNICKSVMLDVCRSCTSCKECWSNNSDKTYVAFSSIVSDISKEGVMSHEDLHTSFKDMCNQSKVVFKSISHLYENYKIKENYDIKLNKFKSLMNTQFSQMEKILDNIYNNIIKSLTTCSKDEEELMNAFKSNNISVDKVSILKDFNNNKKIFIKSRESLCSEIYRKDIPLLIYETLRESMSFDYSSLFDAFKESNEYIYVEDKAFSLSIGICKCSKTGKEDSGDNYSNIILPSNIHLVAICDGMGSGPKASMQSTRVLNMLEEMLSCGCDKNDSFNTINSILMLEEEEIFSTLDVLLFNLNTGFGDFIKAGASPTFIKRDSNIAKIEKEALPIGILENLDIKNSKLQLKNGDLIFMMSDGFFDSIDADENKLKEKIKSLDYRNPQKIANELFEMATSSKVKLIDDVSIIVIKVRNNM